MKIRETRYGDVLVIRFDGNVRNEFATAEDRVRVASESPVEKVVLDIRHRFASNSSVIGWVVKQQVTLKKSGVEVAVLFSPEAYSRLPKMLRERLQVYDTLDAALEFLAH